MYSNVITAIDKILRSYYVSTDITEVELECVTCYNQVLTLEWRVAR